MTFKVMQVSGFLFTRNSKIFSNKTLYKNIIGNKNLFK